MECKHIRQCRAIHSRMQKLRTFAGASTGLRRYQEKLRFRLIGIIFGLAIIPALLVGSVVAWRSSAIQQREALQLQQQIVGQLSARITDYIRSRENELLLLSKVRGLIYLDRDEQKNILSGLLAYDNAYDELRFMDEQGIEQLRLSKKDVFSINQPRMRSDADEFQIPFNSQQTYFSAIQRDPATRVPYITIAVPLIDLRTGETAGVLAADVRFQVIWSLLDEIRPNLDETVYILDAHGELIAHQNPSLALQGVRYALPTRSGPQSGLSGEQVVLAFEPIELGDQVLTSIAELPLAVALQPVYTIVLTTCLAIGITLFIAFWLITWVVQRVVKPIEDLAHTAQAIEAGDYSLKAQVHGNDEIADMARSFNDMTSRLTGSLSELEQTVEQLTQSERKLHASNQELTRFAYIASHDLQEPLRMIASFLQLIEKNYSGQLDANGREYIFYAVDGARRMKEMIQALLDYSRIDTRANPMEELSSLESLETVLRYVQFQLEDIGATVSYDDQMPTIYADRIQFERVLQNLLSNAIKYRSEQPLRIHIQAVECTQAWRFTVADNGIGIKPEHQQRIFEMFQRLHNAADIPGTGIGLTIARRIIDRHNGRIWVESHEGQGTTFSFTIAKPDSG
jgi:signal transduction histidine kinase